MTNVPTFEFPAAASRLCVACGLCCNGVMFYSVQLQPVDSRPQLVSLGLHLKRRHRENFLLQPCPALEPGGCSIYPHRPERCRLFACQQLRRLAAAEITEEQALVKIREAQGRVEEVITWLDRCGRTDPRRPLVKRCEKIFAEPLGPDAKGPDVAHRAGLEQSLRALKHLLNQDFRLTPTLETDSRSDESDAGGGDVPARIDSDSGDDRMPSVG